MPAIPEKFYKVHNKQITQAMGEYIAGQYRGPMSFAILPSDPFHGVSDGPGDETIEIVYFEVCNERGVIKSWVTEGNLAAIERWLEKYKENEIEEFTWPDIFPSSRA